MPVYGLLHTDRDGKLIERLQIDCANESAAVSVARALLSPDGEIALFQDTRRIAMVNKAPRVNAAAD